MEYLNNLLWILATIMLVLSGLYFAIKLNFLHLNFKEMFKSLNDKGESENGISSFESLSVSLGGCIGVGSLAGIALAIYKGGVGTIFWIWISCFLIAPNSLVENTLALMYQKKDPELVGGPAYYIRYGLGYKKLAYIYALIIVFAYLFGFLTIQSNTIAKSFSTFMQIPPIIVGLVVGILSFIIILKGIKGIAKFSSFIVPLMGILYLFVSIFIIIKNINLIPNILLNIIKEAFNFKAIGMGFLSTLIIGIQRGIFSSEAGTGTAAIASGSSNLRNPIKQGFIGIIGVYFTTFIICTSTALIILTSNYNSFNYIDVNGIEITCNALIYHLGNFGNIFLYFCLIAFSFSTIISGYYYIECNLKFLVSKINKFNILLLKIITSLLLILGCVVSPNFIWNMVDILVAILAIINIYSIFSLRFDIKRCYDDFKLNR